MHHQAKPFWAPSSGKQPVDCCFVARKKLLDCPGSSWRNSQRRPLDADVYIFRSVKFEEANRFASADMGKKFREIPARNRCKNANALSR